MSSVKIRRTEQMPEPISLVASAAATSTSINFVLITFLLEQYLDHRDSPSYIQNRFRTAALLMNTAIFLSALSLVAVGISVFSTYNLTVLATVFFGVQLVVLVGGISWTSYKVLF